jgi:hypothetical protein
MKIEVTGQVGPTLISDGVSSQPFRQGKTGEQIISELQGRYYENTVRGNVFMAHAIVTAPVIYSTAAGTGGPLLWNPTPNKNAVILGVTCGITVVTTVAAALGLTGNTGQTSAPTSTTAIDSSGCLYVSAAKPDMNVYRIGTPVNAGNFFLPFAQLHTGALTTDTFGLGFVDIGGLIVVPPNAWCSIAASATATTTIAQLGLIWAEVPV